ncbi:hypothetical protein ACI79C_03305 [Geodermatophilus sp. SYSU D00697]
MSARTVRRALVLGAAVAAATTLAAPTALAAPPAQVEPVTVTLDSAEIGDAPGTVVLSGTVTCDSAAEAAVFGDVAQVQGLDIARDFFGIPVQCSTTPTTWTATTIGALRVFLPVETHITVNAQYCTVELCHTATTRQTLVLSDPADAGAPSEVGNAAAAGDELLVTR